MGMNKITSAIKENSTFLISTHKSPDGDALGSSFALGLALKKMGKNVFYALEKPGGGKYSFLNELNELNGSYGDRSFDVGIFLDSSDPDHLYDASLMERCRIRINIDHHVSNNGYCHLNYVDVNASATGEAVYELLENLNVELDEEIALALYTAIVSDTGNFKYSNVTYKTHDIASKLYRYPNRYWEISRKLFDETTFEKVQLIGYALGRISLIKEGKAAVIHLSHEDLKKFSDDADMEGVINYARDIKGVEVAVMIKETSRDTFKVSFRANTDFDVSKIAVHYGGGGHSKAAGCTIRDMRFEDVLEDIKSHIVF
ncbi:DHH family phosphoesterase [Alkalibacter saccharofermentans]|uniref:Phosphoesterase RecJ domain-containing protein n=1 Tax=Alkalibacter saccharofermentans DSM 14828 TaxID=1120975 RepID=A0A1M4S6P9_9FIRM|nr:bifunctional oligoribonuclease/PAP phosphatase NrnA [Alkalibacter saccharofermentans]SHE27861.1 phosphoesterase RecJ domain-containing protein [Alkalibacter saccharofermentans DSM 14828]